MRGVRLFISALTLSYSACSAPSGPLPAGSPPPVPTSAPLAPARPEPAVGPPTALTAGVVQTVAELPPKKDPTFEDVLKLQKDVAARRPANDEERLRLALLQATAGNLEEAERVLSGVKNRANRMLPYVELYLRRQLGDHEEAGKLLARLDEEGRALAGFGIERAELVRRVRRYRDYVPAESNRVAPGGEVHLYVEPRNFASQASGDRQTFHLRYEWKLIDERSIEQAIPAWDEAPAEAREDKISSNGPVAEFYQSFRLPLPLNLAAGRYRVRVTVTDVIAGKSARQDVPVDVVPVERTR
jgi:hypothetical protein